MRYRAVIVWLDGQDDTMEISNANTTDGLLGGILSDGTIVGVPLNNVRVVTLTPIEDEG